MAHRQKSSKSTGGMPAGYIAAIVIASVAIVAALLIGVMYAVNDKSKKCSLQIVNEQDNGNGNGLLLAQKPHPTIKNHLPVLNAAKPKFQPVVAKRMTQHSTSASVPVLAQTASPAPALAPAPAPAPVSFPASAPAPAAILNPSEASTGGVAQADRAAKHSAHFAAKKHNESVESALKPGSSHSKEKEDAIKASFVAAGLPSMVQGGKEGMSLQHTPSRTIKGTGSALHTDFGESNFAMFDQEGSDKLDKAMALTGTPLRFHETEEAEAINRKAALLNNLAISGKVDASIEEVLSLTAPMVATKSALLRAVQSASNLERDIVLPPPMRFLYDTRLIGSRMESIMPTPTAMEFNNSAGVDHVLSQNSCDGKNFEAY